MPPILDEAKSAGVLQLMTMGTDPETSRFAVKAAETYPEVWAAVGHHPVNREGPNVELLRQLTDSPRVVAIGEVGLDAAHPARAADTAQRRWLHELCELAMEKDLPVSVHMRDKSEETEQVLAAHPGLRGVMHYFSLDWHWALRFLRLGFDLSFSGLITRPSRRELRDVVSRCPEDRLLLETDSPFGTPHKRGREANRPAWLLDTAAVVAKLRGLSIEQLSVIEHRNATQLFSRIR